MECRRIYLVGMDATAYRSLRSNFLDCEVRRVRDGRTLLAHESPLMAVDDAGCVVSPYRMPDGEVTYVQEHLTACEILHPVLVVDPHPQPARAAAVMEAGGLDYSPQPVDSPAVLDRLSLALRWHGRMTDRFRRSRGFLARLRTLTPRESEVCERLVAGWPVKRIAAQLGTSPNTVRNQRARILEKTATRTGAELLRGFFDMLLYRQLFLEPRIRWSSLRPQSGPAAHTPTAAVSSDGHYLTAPGHLEGDMPDFESVLSCELARLFEPGDMSRRQPV